MKRTMVWVGIGALHILIIFLYITFKSNQTRLAYELQFYKQQKQQLADEKKELLIALATATNPSTIKKYAQENLHMRQAALTDVKRLSE
jgi:cell division protein FtsL